MPVVRPLPTAALGGSGVVDNTACQQASGCHVHPGEGVGASPSVTTPPQHLALPPPSFLFLPSHTFSPGSGSPLSHALSASVCLFTNLSSKEGQLSGDSWSYFSRKAGFLFPCLLCSRRGRRYTGHPNPGDQVASGHLCDDLTAFHFSSIRFFLPGVVRWRLSQPCPFTCPYPVLFST